jgi:endonuclease-8
VPEGDSIVRAARALHRALAGRTVTRFESVFTNLNRVDRKAALRGRAIEHVDARGKHVLIWFSGDIVLRSHLRMKGSWHLYRPGEPWRARPHDMRIVIGTEDWEAVAFNVPIAEFVASDAVDDTPALRHLGPDPLGDSFDVSEAVRRIQELESVEIANALLDQRAISGIGNIYKSEVLFACRTSPFTLVHRLPGAQIAQIVSTAQRFLRLGASEGSSGIVTYHGPPRANERFGRTARLWVYGRGGKPCRRCGTRIARRHQGPHARSTYWCTRCQPERS